MFNQKSTSISYFQAAIGATLMVTVTFVVAVLVDAVVGMHSYL